MIDPKPLFPGARVALVAPASAVPEEKLPGALDLVRRLGMEPVLYPSCYFANRDGYLAATDAQRAEDINRAFADKTIDGVWCIRGGYGGQGVRAADCNPFVSKGHRPLETVKAEHGYVFCLRHISFRGACHDPSKAPFSRRQSGAGRPRLRRAGGKTPRRS